MRYDDVVVGVITLSKLGLNQFDRHDLRLLSILADLAATALESARNLARSGALAGELRLLLDVSAELAASLDTRQVVERPRPPSGDRHGRRRVRDLVVGSGERPGREPRLPPGRRAGHARAVLRHRGVPADPAGPRRPDRRPGRRHPAGRRSRGGGAARGGRQSLARDAAARREGRDDRAGGADLARPDRGRRGAPRPRPDDRQRGLDRARERASLRARPAPSRTATR